MLSAICRFIYKENIVIEPLDDVEVGFVGSIAFYFKRILEKCLKDNNLKLGKILKEPMDGLIEKAILFPQLDT